MHILMITNHGHHQWEVVPGLPDTGGQNVFVNEMSQALAKRGHEVTIVNRGGYPDPVTGDRRQGDSLKDKRQRILYLDDGLPAFVRKEDMADRIPFLVQALQERLGQETVPIDLIISHYWDGARLGVEYNKTLARPVMHIWIPHSLGAIKKGNLPPGQWAGLRIDERLQIEQELAQEVDGLGSTSALITKTAREFYHYSGKVLFLPPCVDQERFYPRQVSKEDGVWDFLSELSGRAVRQIQASKIITEISRTDITKRKDVLIRSFALLQRSFPDTFLIVAIDDRLEPLAAELKGLIHDLGLADRVAAVGSVWDLLPTIYAITTIYCTPAVVEGFGMSAQEAAATEVPVVASDRVPFVAEYLIGPNFHKISTDDNRRPIQVGDGAIVVPADDTEGFAQALETILRDEGLRSRMGKNAYKSTVPYFTWENRVSTFLEQIGKSQ